MNRKEIDFYLAWPSELAVAVKIDWTKPFTHDSLNSGLIDEDADAYFYAIIAKHGKEWKTYYIGKVFKQNVSARLRNPDHVAKLNDLKKRYPECTIQISLGKPIFEIGRADENTIDEMEGLLIYSNWHEEMINKRKILTFNSSQQLHIENTGFTAHLLCKHSAYGVFFRTE